MLNQHYRLAHETARQGAIAFIQQSPLDNRLVIIKEPTRSLEQNAMLHALFGELEKHQVCWAGMPRTAEQWKILLISGHAVATGGEAEVVIGLEDELVSIRESSASMTVKRLTSLLEYTMAFCAMHEIKI